jgi:hypothetical protein
MQVVARAPRGALIGLAVIVFLDLDSGPVMGLVEMCRRMGSRGRHCGEQCEVAKHQPGESK